MSLPKAKKFINSIKRYLIHEKPPPRFNFDFLALNLNPFSQRKTINILVRSALLQTFKNDELSWSERGEKKDKERMKRDENGT